MRRTNLFLVFSTVLFIVVIAGMVLNQNGGETVRLIHRFGGQLVVVTGIAALVTHWKSSTSAIKLSTIAAIVLAALAGYAGAQLKDAADYSQMFDLMRGAGMLAFLVSAVTVFFSLKQKSRS